MKHVFNSATAALDALNAIISDGYRNTKEFLPELLEGAFRKHGCTNTADGSHFLDPCFYGDQESAEQELFGHLDEHPWCLVRDDGVTITAERPAEIGEAVFNAAAIDVVHPDAECVVKALGWHPTLVTRGSTRPAKVITLILEPDAGKDEDLAGRKELAGKPIVVTWFPGPALPPSSPHDCEVGDHLTAAEAKSKGWRTVVFDSEAQLG